MFLLYNLLLTLLAPVWATWMWIRASRRAEKPNWKERFGDLPILPKKGARRVWFHAVSVGEVVAAMPILRGLRARDPGAEIVLSVTTSSGHQTAREKAQGLFDHLVYFPIDVARFQLAGMLRVKPRVVAIMETELWMNFLWAAKTVGARTMVVNGRISDRSFRRSRRLAFFYRPLLRMVDRVLAQGETDADRFRALGAQGVEVFGNCKFDQALEGLDADPAAWRQELGLEVGLPVVVVGSTRGADEEALVIEAVGQVGLDAIQVVHAPRHLERVPELAPAVAARFGSVARRSKGERGGYLILDTYGELAAAYSTADVAVVGGGFGPYGGQNLIQPLALGKPVVHGPHMHNFRDAAEAAAVAGATLVAGDAPELAAHLRALAGDPVRRAAMGEAAKRMVEASRGASERYAQAIAEALSG